MIRAFFLLLLLVYYWYFYAYRQERVAKPSTGKPSIAPLYNFQFRSQNSNNFQFFVNKSLVWEHTITDDGFEFRRDRVVRIDPCHGSADDAMIPATGRILYEYLKMNPEIKNSFGFKENSESAVRKGNVFYFKCMAGRVGSLQICPSGTILVANKCENVNSCTDKPDGVKLPHPRLASKFIRCFEEKEVVLNCPRDQIFYHDRCESVKDLTHYCQMFPNSTFLYDDETLVECRNEKLVFIKCKSGTKFINDGDRCEPSNCVGKPDGEKLPLPERRNPPFLFSPGYLVCRNDRIDEIVECPQEWDESLSAGDDLTSLPMVFDGVKCSVPTFCENVFSNDPDVVVPVHEFTKHVKNWKMSKFLDHGAGYECQNRVRKRKVIEAGMLISKRFKAEPACDPPMPQKLPMYEDPNSYYDCTSNKVTRCPPGNFFNGSTCVVEPKDSFKFQNFPMFKFDSLNLESWIKPWEYSKDLPPRCRDPESTYVELYNICSHPDCVDYAFLSQIPDMSILLPRHHRAQCKFHNGEKKLKKESVNFDYQFWSQKIDSRRGREEEEEEEPCVPGQKLQTGNFIWDSSVFATCNPNQPFVFCPSPHSQRIIQVTEGYYACEPPNTTIYKIPPVDWMPFETNELKQLLPIGNVPNQVRVNKSKPQENIPKDGLYIPEGQRVNLLSNQPLNVDVRYRVTHPPNVAFEYDDTRRKRVHTSTPDGGFLVKLRNFTHKPLSFPKYTPILLVDSFERHPLTQ